MKKSAAERANEGQKRGHNAADALFARLLAGKQSKADEKAVTEEKHGNR